MKKYIIGIGIIAFLLIGYFIVDSFLFDGFQPKVINENGFQANYFVKDDANKKTAIILIGGGQWGDYWGEQFANNGFAGLSLPYIRQEGLPKLPEEIDLAYFENAIKWLKTQPTISNNIVMMGASRNAELALLIASTFPELVNGVVAYAPSSVSWSNTVLPYNSNDLKPSWKYKGLDIPYVPMEKISGNDSDKIKMLEYWKNGLEKTDAVTKAMIQVEKINGDILLFSGKDDMVWPSVFMANMIEQRIKESDFKHNFQNIQYEKAGHLISSNPEGRSDFRTGKMNIDNKDYEYEFGGTEEGDTKAKQDAKIKLFEFLEQINRK